ncbi:rhombotarget A [Acinetobacter sp. ANC 5054]|uniref:rhombotarget A n=1 Tax=Acinetobacter sp. ANC 5054 TaxID=1977877 RepID=UPI000A34EDD5|nr:rhombotarget A [Acinetobacter sp. ANC 5054]OTG83490.1 rhombotarget A [Acinetobacter sp. ANC 5054]
MLKQSIGVGMLLVAGHAFSAEITVTTTEDIVKDDKECSLREAIEYINNGMPEAGYNGCGGKDAYASVSLAKNAVYKLEKKIDIKAELNIKTVYDSNVNEDVVLGLNNAVIEMTGKDQIFNINDDDNGVVAVNFKEITFKGCKQDQCAEKGGILYNNEKLTLENVKFQDGYARFGGAIYNEGFSEDGVGSASRLYIRTTIFENNKAVEGGAIYSKAPAYEIYTSLFKGNESSSGGAIVFNANGIADISKLTFANPQNVIANSTFFKNKGFAINVRDGLALNNITVVKNSGGIEFNTTSEHGYLANSVVIGNNLGGTAQDCKIVDSSADQSVLYNNLVGTGCPVGPVANLNDVWSGNSLLAGEDEGTCKTLTEDRTSVFCPFNTPNKTFIGYLRPRILLDYATIFASPILNKGKTTADGNTHHVYCEGSDQRGKTRNLDDVWCDRGAIEIVVPVSMPRLGQDIKVGEVAKFNILDSLGDSDLIPKEECTKVMGMENPTGKPWQDGCPILKQTTDSKGTFTLNLNGDFEYKPDGNWHGADIFELRVVTSSTRFNTSAKNYLAAEVRIVQEPTGEMESKTVKTSGGAIGWTGLFALMGLVGFRRFKKSP